MIDPKYDPNFKWPEKLLPKKALIQEAIKEIHRIWELELNTIARGVPRKLAVTDSGEESKEIIDDLIKKLLKYDDTY